MEFSPDVAILDQASQASWGDTLCYVNLDIERFVLVGDDKQLDPTVISQDKTLKQTMISVLAKKNKYFVMLDVQYRMHPAIAALPNWLFYQNKVVNGVTAAKRQSQNPTFANYPLSFIHHRCPQIEELNS